MTLNDLIRCATKITRLLSSGDIPLLYHGKETDFLITLDTDKMVAELYLWEKKN